MVKETGLAPAYSRLQTGATPISGHSLITTNKNLERDEELESSYPDWKSGKSPYIIIAHLEGEPGTAPS